MRGNPVVATLDLDRHRSKPKRLDQQVPGQAVKRDPSGSGIGHCTQREELRVHSVVAGHGPGLRERLEASPYSTATRPRDSKSRLACGTSFTLGLLPTGGAPLRHEERVTPKYAYLENHGLLRRIHPERVLFVPDVKRLCGFSSDFPVDEGSERAVAMA